ncbi:peptidase A2A [Asticcacaulis biprosthecium C19]|uniref:Peptidase A2A n=1 Tax=Asticcacaulis biprosthecium C19 TaxID=715226 RepID=F4QTX2_9CAUL|nr:peptidase A2A [Asticcacaulis biprosthecium C19]
MLTGAAALGLLPSLASGQEVATQAAPLTDDSEIAELAARNNYDRLTIPVTVNGKGPYQFIVDTGAESSVLSDRVVADLGLSGGVDVIVEGLARRIPAKAVEVAELGFGAFRRKNLLLPVLPRTMLGCDGYLGLDAIERTRVTFDFAHKQVRIEQARNMTWEMTRIDVARIKMEGRAGYLRTGECLVDGVMATAFIDTGAEVSMGNPPLLAALQRKGRVPNTLGQIILAGITGGEIEGQVVPVHAIQMEDLKFTDGVLAIVDVPNFTIWQVDNKPAFLMGMNFLRQFASVAIDYRARELRFQLARLDPKSGQYLA